MRVPFADLRTQYHKLKQEIDASIANVIESGCFIDGENVLRLEHEISELCGSKYGIGVASGTDALVLSLAACGVGAGKVPKAVFPGSVAMQGVHARLRLAAAAWQAQQVRTPPWRA